MKNRLMKILSVLCVLAMLFAVLPIGWAEDGQDAAQETSAQDEAPQIQEEAGEKPVEVTVSAPAAAEDIILVEQKDAEPAEGEASALPEENVPGSGNEDPEDAIPADEADQAPEAAEAAEPAGEPAPAEEAAASANEETVPADPEIPGPAAAEETAPAEGTVTGESSEPSPAEGTAAAEETASAEETAPAEEAESVEETAPMEENVSAEAPESADETAPAEGTAPAEEAESAEESAPTEGSASAEVPAPSEETAPAEEMDTADEAEITEASGEVPEEEKEEPEEEPAEASEAESEAEPEEEPAEEPDEEEGEEPVQLMAGEELTDTVCAGEEYRIRLTPSETGTVMLTLIMDRGQVMNVRIDGEEADLTDIDPENPAQAVYTDELQVTEWQDVDVCLSADADTAFILKTELITAEPAVDTEAPAEETDGEASAEEENTETEMPETEEPAEESTEEPAEENAAESMEENTEETAEEPAEENEETADGETEAMPDGEADEETADEPEHLRESDLRMLEAGCIRVMVIRENGTALYASRAENAEPVSSLACGDVIWARPVGEIWGEVYLDEESGPLYFNLNNVMLQLGEVGYDVPIRRVKLSSSLEGLTEITEGTFVVMSAEISGFMTDEIADITWQYRASEDEEFTDIEDAKGFTYVYPVSAENLHYEWRIVLTIKS